MQSTTVQPTFRQLLQPGHSKSRQNDEMLGAFADQGWLLLKGFVDESLIDRIIDECSGEYGREDHRMASPHRLLDGWKTSPAVKSLALDKGIFDLLKRLYGRTPIPFQTLNFDRGTQQALHSDTIHFCSFPQDFMAGVWVALEDITESNGPLRVVKNSHMLPPADMFSMGLIPGQPKHDNSHRSYAEYEQRLASMVNKLGLETETIEMRKGDVFIWASNLLHGGAPIRDATATRLSQVTHYFFEGCVYFTPLVSDLPNGKLALRTPINITTGKVVGLGEQLAAAKQAGLSKRRFLRSYLYTKTGI